MVELLTNTLNTQNERIEKMIERSYSILLVILIGKHLTKTINTINQTALFYFKYKKTNTQILTRLKG